MADHAMISPEDSIPRVPSRQEDDLRNLQSESDEIVEPVNQDFVHMINKFATTNPMDVGPEEPNTQ